MWQGKPNFYSIRAANLAFLILLAALLTGDLSGALLLFFTGRPMGAGAVLLWRLAAYAGIFLIAVFSARPALALRLRRTAARNIAYTLLLALFAYLSLSVLLRLLAPFVPAAPVPSASSQMRNGLPVALSALFFCALAPIAEETLFRGILQNAYERRIGRWAFVLSGALFGLAHAGPISMLNGAAAGMLAGYVYVKTRSFWCPLLFHALFNFFAFSLLPDYYVIALPWTLGLFPTETLTFAHPNYAVYTAGIALIGLLMCYALIRLLNRSNPENKAKRSAAYVPDRAQWNLAPAIVVLLALRLGVGIAMQL